MAKRHVKHKAHRKVHHKIRKKVSKRHGRGPSGKSKLSKVRKLIRLAKRK